MNSDLGFRIEVQTACVNCLFSLERSDSVLQIFLARYPLSVFLNEQPEGSLALYSCC